MVKIKSGDTKPLDVILTANNKPVPLTGCTVKFSMAPKIVGVGSTVTKADTQITDAAKGKVSYAWQTADTDTPGVHRAEFEVTYGDGTKETFPNGEYLEVEIVADLD